MEMRRVVVTSAGVTIERVLVPVAKPGEVLVRMAVAGVCGSDVHALHGRHPFISLPFAPGHEVSGTVVDTGRRVTVEPPLPCHECKNCVAGRTNVCERLRFFGCAHDQGGFADYFTIDERRLHTIPGELDWPAAALIEPLSTPVHATRLAGGVRDRTVAILGAGTIGLLMLRVAQQQGARRVVMTARSAMRRERALRFGADAVVDASSPEAIEGVRAELGRSGSGQSADVVFDCVAEESTLHQAIGIANKGGTVVVVGVPPGEMSIPLHTVQDSQIRIQGSATYVPEDYAESIALLRAGVVTAADFVTATHSLDDAAAAFRDAESGDHIKVLLVP